ncbi:MAG: hypothetical protein HQ483_04295 [Rhodospirillales bacterium]|nr:hypothetical protein [Rhodospirillales bacterium]
MLQAPSKGHKVFEIAIYNQDVRSLVKENQSHSFFHDHWADCQLQDILAKNEREARELIESRFPADDGFVVESVNVTSF